MIVAFKTGNYKTFKEKVSLNLRGASISKITDAHVIDAGKFKLLKSAAIYGPNASGKSKLLEAMQFMQQFVINSSKNTQAHELIEVDPFRLSTQTLNQPSFFEMEFLLEGKAFRYGFEATRKQVVKEWLFYRPRNVIEKPLFVRIGAQIEITASKFKEGKGIEGRTRNNALFLSAVAQWNGKIAQSIIDWFGKLHFFDPIWDSDDNSETLELISEEKYKKLITQIMKVADLDIDGIEAIEYKDIIAKKSGKKLSLNSTYEHLVTYHKVYDANNKVVDTTFFEMDEDESLGTQRFFNLIGLIIKVLENGGILISDEINASLHPRLMQALVLLFNSKIVNKNNSQFIFTTHDTNLINIDFLSRDQIYFLEKNRYGASNLYSLVEFKTRKDTSHEKEYFNGRYGAIPLINNFEEAFQHIFKSRLND